MKARVPVSFAVLAAVAVSLALAQRPPDRPPNVSGSAWIPINERLGIVLAGAGASPNPPVGIDRGALLLAPPANGYFMVRDGGGWRRLVVIEPLRGPGDAG